MNNSKSICSTLERKQGNLELHIAEINPDEKAFGSIPTWNPTSASSTSHLVQKEKG